MAALVGQGLTNRAIATRLVIAEHTAENHIVHILNKLDVRSRVQIATWAVARGLAGARGPSAGGEAPDAPE